MPRRTWGTSPMPCISLPYDPVIGPILNVLLSKPAVFRQLMIPPPPTAQQGLPPIPAGVIPPGLPPHPPVLLNGALVDTGASITSVTAAVAAQAGLPLIGKRPLGTAGGIVNANVYVADVAIPLGALPAAAAGTQIHVQALNAISFESLVIMEFVSTSSRFNMLLGRDILCQGLFSFGFDGRFTFSI